MCRRVSLMHVRISAARHRRRIGLRGCIRRHIHVHRDRVVAAAASQYCVVQAGHRLATDRAGRPIPVPLAEVGVTPGGKVSVRVTVPNVGGDPA